LTKKEVKELSKALILHYDENNIKNLFNINDFIKNSVNNAVPSVYKETGLQIECTGGDPYVGTALVKDGTLGSNHAVIKVQPQKSYIVSWAHESGPELIKNYLTYVDSNKKAL
jgi:hypothetical protein